MKTKIFSAVLAAFSVILLLSGSAIAKTELHSRASGLENALDPSLKIELWMVNDLTWHPHRRLAQPYHAGESLEIVAGKLNRAAWIAAYEVQEKALPLEAWMCTASVWQTSIMAHPTEMYPAVGMTTHQLSYAMSDASDEKPHLENWMMDDACWEVDRFEILPDADRKLSLDTWMLDSKNWK